MLLEVAVQVGLLAEGAVAERAPEGLLLVVDVAHVALQVGRDAERPLAVLALVRLLARVRAQVAREIGRAREDLAAELARVALLELVARPAPCRRHGRGPVREGVVRGVVGAGAVTVAVRSARLAVHLEQGAAEGLVHVRAQHGERVESREGAGQAGDGEAGEHELGQVLLVRLRQRHLLLLVHPQHGLHQRVGSGERVGHGGRERVLGLGHHRGLHLAEHVRHGRLVVGRADLALAVVAAAAAAAAAVSVAAVDAGGLLADAQVQRGVTGGRGFRGRSLPVRVRDGRRSGLVLGSRTSPGEIEGHLEDARVCFRLGHGGQQVRLEGKPERGGPGREEAATVGGGAHLPGLALDLLARAVLALLLAEGAQLRLAGAAVGQVVAGLQALLLVFRVGAGPRSLLARNGRHGRQAVGAQRHGRGREGRGTEDAVREGGLQDGEGRAPEGREKGVEGAGPVQVHVGRVEAGRRLAPWRQRHGVELVLRVAQPHAGAQRPLAEALVLAERGDGGEGLAAVLALDLLPAVGVHPLVAAQVGELRVGLQTHLQQIKRQSSRYTPVQQKPDPSEGRVTRTADQRQTFRFEPPVTGAKKKKEGKNHSSRILTSRPVKGIGSPRGKRRVGGEGLGRGGGVLDRG